MTETHWERRRAAIGLAVEKAALELFVQHGADNVAVEDIAAAAGMSRRTFFRHFESRDDILAALPMRSLQRMVRDVSERPAHESILTAMMAVARDRPIPADEREVQRLWFQTVTRSPEAWMRALNRLRRESDDAFTEIAAHRLRVSGRSDAQAYVIGAAINAVVRRVYFAWAADGCVGSLPDRLESGLRALGEITAQGEEGRHEEHNSRAGRGRRVGRRLDDGVHQRPRRKRAGS